MTGTRLRRTLEKLFTPERLRRVAVFWLIGAAVAAAVHVWSETRVGLTDGQLHPLGEDFLNFWAGAALAAAGRARDVYDFGAFHTFQLAVVGGPIQLYHYSYPPVLLMLCRPLALLPYPAAWVLWCLASWAAFAAALRSHWRSPSAWLYALAVPATFVNAMDGQNGLWAAAILGAGLAWLPRRPLAAGAVFAVLLACKPQLALLLPLALLAGRDWKALASLLVCSALLVLATLPLYGWELWLAYRERVAILRQVILENGGTWAYMPSVFIMVRHLSLPIWAAYAAQAGVTAAVAILVMRLWRSDAGRASKNAMLVLGLLLASPYVQNYDLAIAALVPVWLLAGSPPEDPRRLPLFLASALLLAAPSLVPLLAWGTGVGLGWLLPLPALWLTWRQSDGAAAGRRPGEVSAGG